jgi:predicted MFS family arabinose efflux permease
VISLILVRFSFEVGIVSTIPLMSEQVPEQRGKVLTLGAVVNLLAATLVGFTGPWAYTQLGVWGLGPVSAIAIFCSLLVLWRWVKE